MAADSERSSSIHSSGVHEELSPEIGVLGSLAIGAGSMTEAGIFVRSGFAVDTGDPRD